MMFDYKAFPRTSILLGNSNIDKDNFINKVADSFHLLIEDITDKISLEYINDIYSRTNFYCYIIDIDRLTIKSQNIILKFIEEPLNSSFIFLKTINERRVISTILGRCYKYYLGNHLNEYGDYIDTIDENNIYSSNIESIEVLCHNIFDNINKATLSNSLTLTNKIDSKYGICNFINILNKVAAKRVILNKNKCFEQYMLTKELYNNIFISTINEVELFENYLCKLKEI